MQYPRIIFLLITFICTFPVALMSQEGSLGRQMDSPSASSHRLQSNDSVGQAFSKQDRLRGSITPERAWWNLKFYHLKIEVLPKTKSIRGSNTIRFTTVESAQRMQIDLQQPLSITDVLYDGRKLKFERDGNVYWIKFPEPLEKASEHAIEIFYEGIPTEAKRPPWDGGFSWDTDELGNPFIATACQGIGASIWWPCKDHGYDEPEDGMRISVTVPENLTAVANGRLKDIEHDSENHTKIFDWVVTQPINNYAVNVNIGNYVNFSDTYTGEFGSLDLDYWVLDHQRETAEKHFKEAPRTIEAFEYWFGKYPFYEDSYKLVVVPYTGMEHQSSVTYGNGFKNGYRGVDLSGTGVGSKFDFIIVHESGHEWFGNNISMRDAADMWIHESFTNYSENLFVEYHFSKKEAEDYVIGCRQRIKNDIPIIGQYNVNQQGSGDMYYKGGNMLHTLRHVVNDDEKWRNILRGLNKTFWHQTVRTLEIENYISRQSGLELKPFFDQYLRTTQIPEFRYDVEGNSLNYQFANVVAGFSIPLRVRINEQEIWLTPTEQSQSLDWENDIQSVVVDRNFYLTNTPR